MERVSTNLTLFYKFFIPVFWIVFFGAFTIAVWSFRHAYYGEIPGPALRIGALFFYFSGLVLLGLTLMRLKRVEMSTDFVYVTNYFRHFRYPFHQIEKITESNFLFLKIVNLYLKEPGHFGRRITFVASNDRYTAFWAEHPEAGSRFFGRT